jgi:hypothetical protein
MTDTKQTDELTRRRAELQDIREKIGQVKGQIGINTAQLYRNSTLDAELRKLEAALSAAEEEKKRATLALEVAKREKWSSRVSQVH